MCGIAGFLAARPFGSTGQGAHILADMTAAIQHRGPDAEGSWIDEETGIALGHRRLSILDLSEAGAQPMHAADGRFVMVYNGEIYNHLSLRTALQDADPTLSWRGTSDTETLLAGIARWGLHDTLRQCCGMFAVAVWDRSNRTLTLARDNMGEKPLYFRRTEQGLVFASELKALCAGPGAKPKLDQRAVRSYLNYGYVPEGHCILQGVSKLRPGHTAEIRLDSDVITISRFGGFEKLSDAGRAGALAADGFDRAEQSQKLETLLGEVVGEQMLSDVPLGCFLSGGVDSSLVASLMQAQGGARTRTFSIGFEEDRFDESRYAAKVAEHLKTEHTEFILKETDALNIVPELPQIYDEPFADSSQIPTTILCREARKHVTVALTGDGADEIFGGYNRHFYGPVIWQKASAVPSSLRAAAGKLASGFERLAVNENSVTRRLAKRMKLPVTAIDKGARLAAAIGQARQFEDLYTHFTQTFQSSDGTFGAPYGIQEGQVFCDPKATAGMTSAEWMMAMDAVTYLPGDILVKVDRAAMSTSLETRAPFLDPRIIQAAWQLPESARVGRKSGKLILRDILYRHVPRALIERPKQGFSIPVDRWLRGALKDWAETLLGREDLLGVAGIKVEPVQALWHAHITGRNNNGQKLWVLLMLISWLDHYCDIIETDDTFAEEMV